MRTGTWRETVDGVPRAYVMAAGRLHITIAEYRAHLHAGEQWCSGHKCWEPMDAFSPGKRVGLTKRTCRAWNSARWQARPRSGPWRCSRCGANHAGWHIAKAQEAVLGFIYTESINDTTVTMAVAPSRPRNCLKDAIQLRLRRLMSSSCASGRSLK